MSAKNYFDKVAENYNEKRAKGIFGHFVNLILVNKERKLIVKKLDAKKNELILDAGCGAGLYSNIIAKSGANVFGIDISYEMIRNYTFNGVVSSIENIPFNFNFDKILCAGALEFSDYKKSLESFNNSLKKNGKLILLYPKRNLFGFMYVLYHRFHNVKIHVFSNKEIVKLLENNNFRIISVDKPTLLTGLIAAYKL